MASEDPMFTSSILDDESGIVPKIMPEGLDTFSTVLLILVIISAIYQVLYMLSPQALKKVLEHYDYEDAIVH